MRYLLCLLITLLPAATAQADERVDALVAAQDAYTAGQFAECVAQYEKAIALGATRSDVYYNCACCYSRAGVMNKAFVYLARAIANGYREAQWLEFDPDLEPLHDHPQWQTMVNQCRQVLADYLATVNTELYWIMQEDQGDRMQEDGLWDSVIVRDRIRRARVGQLLDSGLVRAADDYFHAAMVFQHGEDSTAFFRANQLAKKAVELDSTNNSAWWLIAASWDRYLWSIGKGQWYGTQSSLFIGKWSLNPIDTTAVTDAERAKYGVPPLAEARRRIRQRNLEEFGK